MSQRYSEAQPFNDLKVKRSILNWYCLLVWLITRAALFCTSWNRCSLLDMSKAFDTIIKFIANYIKGRKAYTTHPDTVNLKLAFHKAASFYPPYFNIYTQTYHHPVHRFRSWPTHMTSPSHPHTQARVQPINIYNHTYITFLPGQKQNNLILNWDKTTCTLFTPGPAEYTSNLDLKIHNTALPMATHPKVLGLTLDPKLTYSTHIYNISVQAHTSLQIINALTATVWGKQKETSWLPRRKLWDQLWSMPLPYGRLLHPRPALTKYKSSKTQHWELPQDAHKTQTCNICMTKHSHFPYTSTYSSTPHNTNIKHNIHHIHVTSTQYTSTLQG